MVTFAKIFAASSNIPFAIKKELLRWSTWGLRLIPAIHGAVPGNTHSTPPTPLWQPVKHLMRINRTNYCSPLSTTCAAAAYPFHLRASLPTSCDSSWRKPCFRFICCFQLLGPQLHERFEGFISAFIVWFLGSLNERIDMIKRRSNEDECGLGKIITCTTIGTAICFLTSQQFLSAS